MNGIVLPYPVWRARDLPFGHGVLSLPQRGQNALEMYECNTGSKDPVERFEGHDDTVKEFVWRRGDMFEHTRRLWDLTFSPRQPGVSAHYAI